MGARARLGEILLEAGEIDAAQLEAALRRHEETGRPLGLTLVDMGALPEEALVRTLSQQLSLPMARLEGKRIAAETLALVPFDLAEKHRCFPLFVKDEGTGGALYLGMEDASDLDAIEALTGRTGLTIRPVLVAPSEIEEALHRQYHAMASSAPAPLQAPGPEVAEEGQPDPLPPPPGDPGFDGTGLPEELEVGPDAIAIAAGDVDFDSQGLEAGQGAEEPVGDVNAPGNGADWDAEAELDPADDLEVDLDVGRDLELDAEPGPREVREPRADSLDDSLADFAPELEVDAPAPQPRAPQAPASGSEPVSRDAILRALTQLLVEKGLIDREELVERVHRENGGDGA